MPSQAKSQKQGKSSSGAIRERRVSVAAEAMAIYERKPRTPRQSRPNSPILHRPESMSAVGSEAGSQAGSPDSEAADLPELAELGAASYQASAQDASLRPGQWAQPDQGVPPSGWIKTPPPATWQDKDQNVLWTGRRAGDPGSVEPADVAMSGQPGMH
jgi:hypothetical protein